MITLSTILIIAFIPNTLPYEVFIATFLLDAVGLLITDSIVREWIGRRK